MGGMSPGVARAMRGQLRRHARADPAGGHEGRAGVGLDRRCAAIRERLLFFPRSAHRAVRHPPRAHGAAVGLAGRLHCAARSGRARHNSLRADALRSDKCRESDGKARTACAPRPGLRCASPHKSPLPGAARREVGAGAVWDRTPRALPRRRCGAGRDAPVGRREALRLWPRAQRASTTDLAHLSERSAKRVASYAPGQGRIAGQSAQPTAPPKRRGLPRTGFATTKVTHVQRTSNFSKAPQSAYRFTLL